MPMPPYRVDYGPTVEHTRLEWPNGASVALWDPRITLSPLLASSKKRFDTLYRDREQNGRLMALNLHP